MRGIIISPLRWERVPAGRVTAYPLGKKRLPVGENQPISPFILVPAYSLLSEKFSLCKQL